MVAKAPIAFFSYVRSDDEHEGGTITNLRKRLEGEVKLQTGDEFPIFQDRNDIKWGQLWKERIETTILDVTFLIPIITPTYFKSEMCRKEFETFQIREKALGEDRLILPIHYVEAKQLSAGFAEGSDQIADVLRARNWADWRDFRFEASDSTRLKRAIAEMAKTIGAAMEELNGVLATATRKSPPAKPPSPPKPPTAPTMTAYSTLVESARGKQLDPARIDAVRAHDYYAYTTRYDEVIVPTELSEPADTLMLQSHLLRRVGVAQRTHASKIRLAQELIDKEVGVTALGRANLSITILIDNSGSMRATKIFTVATWISIISELLQAADIPHEILGFTTRAWKGGQSRELWLRDGSPPAPGRLNDLRHLIYKDHNMSVQEAIPNFAIMMREGLLKENIDGEALLWAYSRLSQQPAERRILLMISDGAPVDDSTLSVNPGNYLEKHVLATTDWIRAQGDVELFGAGIGHAVDRYYRGQSIALDEEGFGLQLVGALIAAITTDRSHLPSFSEPTEVIVAEKPLGKKRVKRRATKAIA